MKCIKGWSIHGKYKMTYFSIKLLSQTTSYLRPYLVLRQNLDRSHALDSLFTFMEPVPLNSVSYFYTALKKIIIILCQYSCFTVHNLTLYDWNKTQAVSLIFQKKKQP